MLDSLVAETSRELRHTEIGPKEDADRPRRARPQVPEDLDQCVVVVRIRISLKDAVNRPEFRGDSGAWV